MDIVEMQKQIYQNKIDKGFDIRDCKENIYNLVSKSKDVNGKSVRTAGAAYLVFSRLLRQTEYTLAFFAFAINVCLSVAYAVALKAEKAGELFYQSQKRAGMYGWRM